MIKIKICNLSQLKNKNYFVTWVKKIKDEVIVFKNDKKIYVKSSICPHFGGPIGYHDIKVVNNKAVFTCLWHNLQFCINLYVVLHYN